MDKILGEIYLGDMDDAGNSNWDGDIISCLQDLPENIPIRALWIPIIRVAGRLSDNKLIADQEMEIVALRQQLDLVAREIEDRFKRGQKTLVHCLASMERSPLAIVHWLHQYHNMSYNTAYEYVTKRHPITLNRLEWLNLSYDEATE